MFRLSPILLCAWACLAQQAKEPPKPPPDVDRALRARVTEFVQYHVTGEFRKAEALVAEDSKDLFYNRNKPRYMKFIEIARIDYNEDFTKATVIVSVVMPTLLPGWEGGPPTVPIPLTWKIEEGKWCWYLPPETLLRTPFGAIPLNSAAAASATAPGQMPALPGIAGPSPALPPADADPKALAAIAGARQLGMGPAIPGAVPESARRKILPDKTAVTLSAGKTETVTFTNSGDDGRTLMLLGGLPGVEAKLDRAEVAAGQTAVLTLRAGKDAIDGVLHFAIPQTSEMLDITISIK